MKNIQLIDGARNCTYSLFAATNDEFRLLFPGDTDVAFPDEITKRLGCRRARAVLGAVWKRPVDKKRAIGIHGTLFYGLDFKRKLYPTRQERGMDPRSYSLPQRLLLRNGARDVATRLRPRASPVSRTSPVERQLVEGRRSRERIHRP